MSKNIWHQQKREYYVLHNAPFYFIETVSATPPPTVRITKVVRSLYDLQKSAAHWNICDYGVTRSPDCST